MRIATIALGLMIVGVSCIVGALIVALYEVVKIGRL
jgi:hypothetical protein